MKKTLFLVAALCTAVAQAETIQYNSTQTVGGNKALTEDTTFEVATGATVTRTGNISSDKAGVNLIKEGEGTLKARVNDSSDSNPFVGNVTVNKGTLEIYAEAGLKKASTIGAGEGATVTVAKGATLQFDGNAGINIPSANVSYSSANAVAVRNGETTIDAYGTSQLSNVKVTTNAIVAVDASARGSVTANEVALTDTTHATKNVIQGVDLKVNEFSVTGDAVVDNTTVRAAQTLTQPLLSDASIEVKNGSKLILDNETYKNSGLEAAAQPHNAWLRNTTVDKTSYINAGDKNGKLTEDMLSMSAFDKFYYYVQLQQGNELHIASSGKEGGVANQYFRNADGDIVATIEGLKEVEDVYVTDQLSGCALQVGSELMVTLDDTMLPDPMAFETFTFTVVLQGLDSTAVLEATQGDFESGKFYDMEDSSPVQLAIGAYKDAPWYKMDTTIQLAAFSGNEPSWKGDGPATVFKFTVTGLVVPEPTTATLSLLALAGLAARRRRH